MDKSDLFVKANAPVRFCFHESVKQGHDQITRDVEQHSGQIVNDEHVANVLLVNEQEDIAFLRMRYYHLMSLYRLCIYIEPHGFIQACIQSGTYEHVGPVKRGIPGRAPGRGAKSCVPFTKRDRERLARYLAVHFPAHDGRMKNGVYKELERLGRGKDMTIVWASRHTWRSWRDHYKMHKNIMDPLVNCYVQRHEEQQEHGNQGVWSSPDF